jgi:hypothetical protein
MVGSPRPFNRFNRTYETGPDNQTPSSSDLWAVPGEDAVGSFDSKGVFRLATEDESFEGSSSSRVRKVYFLLSTLV